MYRKYLRLIALFFCLSAFTFSAVSQNTPLAYYVNIHNGNDTNNGLSWSSAVKSLQIAIDKAVKGDTIKVAAGIYRPTKKMAEVYNTNSPIIYPTNDRHRCFLIKKDILLYGGFPAEVIDETTMDARDWKKNETVLSGDFYGDDDDLFDNKNENALHVVVLLNTTANTLLDGFFISGGHAALDSADVYVDQVIVQQHCGGGVYALSKYESSPTLTNVMIRNNTAEKDGGGFYNYSESGHASPKLTDVTLINNFADERGGGFYNDGMVAKPMLLNVNLTGNFSSAFGGGLFLIAEKEMSPQFENVLISGNKSKTGGGAYLISLLENATPVLTNITICGNLSTSNKGGGLIISAQSTVAAPIFRNSVVWGNKDNLTVEGRNGANPVFENCLIEGMALGGTNISGNIDPLFVNPVDANFAMTVVGYGDYRLRPESPLIDKGNNDYITLSEDIDGQTRIFGNAVDIGAFEWFDDPSGNEDLPTDQRIWSHHNVCYVKITQSAITIRVYSMEGRLIKQINHPDEGISSFSLPCGHYFIVLSSGESAKIRIK